MVVKLKSGEKVRAVIEEAALISGCGSQLQHKETVSIEGCWVHTALPSNDLANLSIAGTMNVREQRR